MDVKYPTLTLIELELHSALGYLAVRLGNELYESQLQVMYELHTHLSVEWTLKVLLRLAAPKLALRYSVAKSVICSGGRSFYCRIYRHCCYLNLDHCILHGRLHHLSRSILKLLWLNGGLFL